MSKYQIQESTSHGRQDVNSYEDLEIHHPTANANGLRTGRTEDFQQPGKRPHERVDGVFEEVRHTRDGGLLVEKDFILSRDGRGTVNIPAPISGFIHYTNDRTATVQIFDQPNGQGKLLAQVLHMDASSFTLKEGAKVEYGQALGAQGQTGSPNSIHAHVEVNIDQFKKYIRDIANGAITPDTYPARGTTQADPAHATHASPFVHGVLKHGERGPEIAALQTQLNALGFKDAHDKALISDGDFGERTKQAVKAFQKTHGLVADGDVGMETFTELKKSRAAAVTAPSPSLTINADQSPLLSNPNHPDHALYKQALAGIEKLPATAFKSDLERQNAAATVVFEAKVSGISRIDNVALSTNGNGLFAVQGGMNDPAHHRIYVDKSQAAAQPIEKSTQQLQQENLQQAQPVQAPEQQKRAMTV